MKSNHKGEMCWVPLSSLKYVFRVFKIIHLSIFDWLAGFITGTSPTWLQPSKALCGGYSEATLRLSQQFSYRSLHLHFCLLYPCFPLPSRQHSSLVKNSDLITPLHKFHHDFLFHAMKCKRFAVHTNSFITWPFTLHSPLKK